MRIVFFPLKRLGKAFTWKSTCFGRRQVGVGARPHVWINFRMPITNRFRSFVQPARRCGATAYETRCQERCTCLTMFGDCSALVMNCFLYSAQRCIAADDERWYEGRIAWIAASAFRMWWWICWWWFRRGAHCSLAGTWWRCGKHGFEEVDALRKTGLLVFVLEALDAPAAILSRMLAEDGEALRVSSRGTEGIWWKCLTTLKIWGMRRALLPQKVMRLCLYVHIWAINKQRRTRKSAAPASKAS